MRCGNMVSLGAHGRTYVLEVVIRMLLMNDYSFG